MVKLTDEMSAEIEQHFNEDQRKVLLSIIKENDEDTLKELVRETLDEARGDKDDLQLDDNSNNKEIRKHKARVKKFGQIWRNNGYVEGCDEQIGIEDLIQKDQEIFNKNKQRRMTDAQFSTDLPLAIPRVLESMAREAIEPNLVLTPLLQTVNFNAGSRVVFPAWGAITAADIPEGGEYPERTLDLAGQVEATIGKSGVAIKVTDETIRYNQFDVISMHVRAAGRALARWKEQKVADLILDNGTVLMDNDQAHIKSSTGRDAAGSYNGTLTLDDIFHVYGVMVNSGFIPNTLIMHPFAWKIFAQEGIARAFGFVNGVNPLMWQLPQGSPGNANPWRQGRLNQETYVSSPQNIASTFTQVPTIFPTNFRIIVTPYMTYNASTERTTLALCDSNELGVMVVDENVVSEEWDDPARDIRKIKFRERYAVAMINAGKGVGLLKDISLAKSFDFADKLQATIPGGTTTALTGSLTGDATYSGNI